MPLPLIPILGGAALLGAFGFAADKAGEGINDTANGVVKVVIVGAVAYFVVKRLR